MSDSFFSFHDDEFLPMEHLPIDIDIPLSSAAAGGHDISHLLDCFFSPPRGVTPPPAEPLLTDTEFYTSFWEGAEMEAEPVGEEEEEPDMMEIGWIQDVWGALHDGGGATEGAGADMIALLDEMLSGYWDDDGGVGPAVPEGRRVAVEDLPVVALRAADMARGVNCCAVCVEDYSEGEQVSRLPCAHCFHRDCVVPWFESRDTCPICRFKLV